MNSIYYQFPSRLSIISKEKIIFLQKKKKRGKELIF